MPVAKQKALLLVTTKKESKNNNRSSWIKLNILYPQHEGVTVLHYNGVDKRKITSTMSATIVSSPRSQSNPLLESGIPAGVITEVHFRRDFQRLIDAITFQDGIPQLLFDDLESNDADKVLNAIKGLSPLFESIAPKDEFNDFLSLGGHVLLALTLRKWMENAEVVACCCCCIARMIQKYEIGDRNFHIVRPLRLAGCMDHVVTALVKYKTTRDIQIFGIAALGNLCSGSHQYAQACQAAQRLATELNGVDVVSEASKQFPEDEYLHEVISSFLARLCFLGLGELPVLKEKALVPLSEAVRLFPNNRIIEKNAALFMAAVVRS